MIIQASYSFGKESKSEVVSTTKKCRVEEITTKKHSSRGKSQSTAGKQEVSIKIADFKNQEMTLNVFFPASPKDFEAVK